MDKAMATDQDEMPWSFFDRVIGVARDVLFVIGVFCAVMFVLALLA
jgi:hypothetical protein